MEAFYFQFLDKDTYRAFFPVGTPSEFQRILQLKGLKTSRATNHIAKKIGKRGLPIYTLSGKMEPDCTRASPPEGRCLPQLDSKGFLLSPNQQHRVSKTSSIYTLSGNRTFLPFTICHVVRAS